ncbi:GOLPH3/VPS74 family protein [Brachybacterium sp. DNPG3]
MSTSTIIPGELFLLLTNDAGRQDSTQFRRLALAAAAVAELALRDRIRLDEARSPRVEVLDASPTGEPVLDAALEGLVDLNSPRLRGALSSRLLDLTEVIGDELAAAGAVRRKDGWFLTSWPTADPGLEQALRRRLARAIAEPASASVQDAILLELLLAQRIGHRILRDEIGAMSRRELERVVDGFRIDDPTAAALRAIIDQTAAALVAATAVAGGVAAAGG